MSSERLGCVALNSMPFLSPDLPLETMSTSDMFDTSWDCSSGVDSEISDANIAPSLIPPEVIDDNFFVWNTEHILQTNLFETELETCFEDDIAVLSPVSSLHAKEDINFFHSEDSNMLSPSSSSLTLTSCALPQSPYCFLENLEDVQISTSPSLHMLSSLANCSVVSASLSCILPDNVFSEELQNSEAHSSRHLLQESISKLNSKAEIKGCEERASHPGKRTKVLRSPLATSSQLSSNNNVLFHSIADVPHKKQLPSTYQQYKASTKENGISPRKKKTSNILDSNMKWSELDSSEQWAVGKGIGVMLSQSWGIREKLNLLNILSSTSPDISLTSGDTDLISSLDDEKLERIRLYLRGLDNIDDNSTSRLPINKYGKVLQKYNNKNYLRRNESLQCSSNEHKILGVGKVEDRPNMSEGINLKLTKTQHSRRFPRHDPLIMTHLSSHTRSSKKNATQKFKQNKTRKKYTSPDLHLQYIRSKKEHRQLMKEKKSGLFEQEEVVLVSTTTYRESVQQYDHNKDEEEIDILG
ncbi:hypothetical protein OTU49_002710 [Cherax quadricarinatus]|uniref:Uncharacterized protein n=2 Tax=Cherax quadricarinatus TaxID=27406 RepID=A0AAW0XCQ7_CHEQU